MLLQGIPADNLLLTKETEDNLKDLAGNAMSTTVVGACMLSALLAGLDAIQSAPVTPSRGTIGNLVPSSLVPPSEVRVCQDFVTYKDNELNLSPAPLDCNDWGRLLEDAELSARKCVTEGPEEALPLKRNNNGPEDSDHPVVCTECGHSSSSRNSKGKFEEHCYVPMTGRPRTEPLEFRKRFLSCLPMIVFIDGLDTHNLKQPEGCDGSLWKGWSRVLYEATTPQFRLRKVVRSHIWSAHYSSTGRARLEARVSKSGISWLLFCDPCNADSEDLQAALENPLARLLSKKPIEGGRKFINSGTWDVNLPVKEVLSLQIKGEGAKVDSWRKRLGLQGEFSNEYQFESLSVSVQSGGSKTLNKMIEGKYRILPKCGGPCGSLRKRCGGDVDDPVFFFLESGRTSLPDRDFFVFAPSCHRSSFSEYRECFVSLDADAHFRPVHTGDLHAFEKTVSAQTPGTWIRATGASLKFVDKTLYKSSPASCSDISVPMLVDSWKKCPEIVQCNIPVDADDILMTYCSRVGEVADLNLSKSNDVLERIAFVSSRLTLPNHLSNGRWQLSERRDGTGDSVSAACSPKIPVVRWKRVKRKGRDGYEPVEDGQEAAAYERALKNRPNPWVVRFHSSNSTLSIQIGCNAASLCHRALGLLSDAPVLRQMLQTAVTSHQCDGSLDCKYDWRIVEHVERSFVSFPSLRFTSNRQDREAAQPPNFKLELRREQLRSLSWMLKQESSSIVFQEEEVAESILPGLRWRAEGRVRRPSLVRGGIVADQVSTLHRSRAKRSS